MKRFITIASLGLGLCQAVLGQPSAIYQNHGIITSAPVVDAKIFLNTGDFEINSVLNLTNLNEQSSLFGFGIVSIPYMTKDTLAFTNTGIMSGEPGFRFDTGTSTSRHSTGVLFNSGTIAGIDTIAPLDLFSTPGGTVFIPVPVDDQPIPSQLIVRATNIINTGAMSVDNCGAMHLIGNNVTNVFGSLAAGTPATVNNNLLTTTTEVIEATGLQGLDDWAAANGQYFFIGSPGVYDLFWGVTNGEAIAVDGVATELNALATGGFATLPTPAVTPRANSFAFGGFPLNVGTAQWSATAIANVVNVTNIYYSIVLVNTNFANTNMTATVGFVQGGFDPQDILTPVTDDGLAFEAIVQFAEPVMDIVTGQVVTNGIYVIDDGAILPTMVEADNASTPDGFNRPNAFELTTVTPPQWFEAQIEAAEFAAPFDPTLILTEGVFNNNKPALEISEYGAQIGHNPADVSGSFSSLANPATVAFSYLSDFIVDLTDPTNEPGRIEITAGNLDISHARMRAEGLVNLNATNLIGGGTAAVDWGEANAAIGVANGSLTISNIFPTTFQRVRGDVYAWSGTWQNSQTNGVTNQWHFHVTVVDQNLFGSFPSSVRNLTLTGKKSVTLQDTLNVINQVTINTTNLSINSSNFFSQDAEDFTPASTPFLQNLLINTNGFLGAFNVLDIGFNVNQASATPTGRSYTVNSITNLGQMLSTAPLLESSNFENDGTITSDNGGSIVIEANTLGLGLALTNTINALEADGSVNLSAAIIKATNSVINAGLALPGGLTLYATEELSDGVSGTPTTNTNSVIVNSWTVTGGFSLPVKPSVGDLFGTEIITISSIEQQADHVWAGEDRGATPLGFVNNEVIGRLVLDRVSVTNSALRFSAAGTRNAMYVDYLEFTNSSTNYRSGIEIDPNLTIYFADSNIDPEKLTNVYPGLVWVSSFVGPNSTQVVPYSNSAVVCLMNAAVANSSDIAFWGGQANADFLKNSPYLLNNPTNWTDIMDCPGIYSFPCNCTSGTNGYQLLYTNTAPLGGNPNIVLNVLTVASNGNGTITPMLTGSELVLGNTYTLTATPSKGWVFDNWVLASVEGVTTSYSNVLTFAFVTNTVATATFIPTPFPALKGVYNGLFFSTNGIDPTSSGAVTLTMGATGSFSGKLLMGPNTYTFSSQFSGSGAASFVAVSKVGALTVNLQLDITGLTDEIMGDVTNSGAWDSALTADFAPTWTVKNPSPVAGNYTMVLPWDLGTQASMPGGDSYGTATVSKLGVLTLVGALADGATFSATAPVSKNGQWPFYTYVASKQDTVSGWVTVDTNGMNGTNISWYKAPFTGVLDNNGFTNILPMTGSPWHTPTKASPALSLAAPILVLSGGDLPVTLTNLVTTKNSLTYSATNVVLTIAPATGKFTGTFENPVTRKRQTMSGVILTNEDIGRGFFLGTDASGAVLLQSQ